MDKRLRLTKTELLEGALRARAKELDSDQGEDVWAATLGAWKRAGRPQSTVRRTRPAFEESLRRHQKRQRSA